MGWGLGLGLGLRVRVLAPHQAALEVKVEAIVHAPGLGACEEGLGMGEVPG